MSGAPAIAVAVLLAPGASAAGALDALEAAGAGDAWVVELEAPGAWAAARNAALEVAAGAEVLAFVEDDVRVGPGWGAALREAWSAPGASTLGVVGGPLRAGAAPAWLRPEEHAEVLALAGGRDGVFAGGNVSFRVAALRGIGGFFPVRGGADVRDTFGEDRRAQAELAAAGWNAACAEGMAATRDLRGLTPAALLRRRLRTGARGSVLAAGGSDRAGGARLAARAGAAAAARALRGDGAGALDRAAWAAGGAGALAGELAAHATLQPDRARTALRRAVPAPAPGPVARRLPRRAPRAIGAVLLYHRVHDGPEDPLALRVRPARFAEQMAVLAERWTPAPLEAVLSGEGGPHAVAVTFDDGYADNLHHALPVLREAGVPATLFASTGHVATGEGFWWDEVARLLGEAGDDERAREPLTLELPGGARAWAPRSAAQRAAVRTHIHAALQTRERATIEAALAALRRWAGRPPEPVPPPEADRPLTVEELERLAAAGPFDVQAHGRTHLSLAWAPPEVRAGELRGSADDLEGWLGRRPTAFAFPYGVPGVDVDDAARAAAREAGYRCAVLNSPGLVRRGGDPLAVPRLAAGDLGGAAFARWLGAVFPGR